MPMHFGVTVSSSRLQGIYEQESITLTAEFVIIITFEHLVALIHLRCFCIQGNQTHDLGVGSAILYDNNTVVLK